MKLFINARFLTQTVTGVQRYAINVVEQLGRFLETGQIAHNRFDIRLVSPSTQALTDLDAQIIPSYRSGPFKGQVWEQLTLPRLAGGNLVWSPCNIGPLACSNQIITIHDTSPLDNPAWFDLRFSLWYRFLIPRLARRARIVITDSAFSKSRILHHTGIQADRVVVIPAGVEDRFRPQEAGLPLRPAGNPLPELYLLYVGSIEPRKNLKNLLTAWEMAAPVLPDITLVVAGTTGRAFRQSGIDHTPPRTYFLGYIRDEELVSLYQGARAFVYPSLYEGFGLPPLEAMACGTPVLTSPRTSLPEVVGDSALLVDPLSPESIKEGIEEIVQNEELRSHLRAKGLAQARTFTWERTAREIWRVLESQLVNKAGIL